jgi:hypothetical protein
MAVRTTEVGYHDLVADLKHPGCPVCRGADRSAWTLIDSILWESVNDAPTRLRMRASHGLCRDYLFLAASVASSQSAGVGMAILLKDFLQHIEEEATELAERPPKDRRERRRPALDPQGSCMACETSNRVAHNCLRLLAATEPDDDLGVALRDPGRGICIPHLVRGFRWFPTQNERRRLLAHFTHGNEELQGELAAYIRKHDYQHHHEVMTDGERSCWPRAIARLVGAPMPTRPLQR